LSLLLCGARPAPIAQAPAHADSKHARHCGENWTVCDQAPEPPEAAASPTTQPALPLLETIMSMRYPPLDAAAPADRRTRELVAALLRVASRGLDAFAERLALVEARPAPSEPLLEYHAEAGAPEGALYVNGDLVGHVIGVTRL
jgi:hypothetical protein